MTTIEQLGLDERVLAGAVTFLSFGPAPMSELVRVLGQHLEIEDRDVVHAAVLHLIKAGMLHAGGYLVSLPAGDDARDTEEPK